MQGQLAALGFTVEEKSWLNPIEGIWSVHVADRDCPLLYTNGKGASELAARASALGEFFERLACHYFWTHYHLGPHYATHAFTHFPQERWFAPGKGGRWPAEILSKKLHAFYNPDAALDAEVLVDHNSGNVARGICALPFVRQADGETVYFPVNILGNLYLSNGMAAGNTAPEARAQALAEIVERAVKFRVIREGLCLPDVPEAVLARYPALAAEVAALRAADVLVSDTSSIVSEFLVQHKPVVTFRNRVPEAYMLDFDDPAQLPWMLGRALAREPEHMARITAYADSIHPWRDGRSSQRVIAAADALLAGELGTLARKPLSACLRRLQIRRDLGYWGRSIG